MKIHKFYAPGDSNVMQYCLQYLQRAGCTTLTEPDPSVTDFLLPVPTFNADGSLRSSIPLEAYLQQLPKEVTVFGGYLTHPALADYQTVDFLQDPVYLAENAAITAHCALKVALQRLPVTLQQLPVLVIGWGRIGKCLAHLLQCIGAQVSVWARKEQDRAIAAALGYDTADITAPAYDLMRYRVIFNTVPHLLLSEELMQNCREDCLKIDLASTPGMAGTDVIHARGLPGKDTPESSGILIAKSVLRHISGKESAV